MWLDEFVTSTVGFALAVAVLAAVVMLVVYGYSLYVQHEVLKDYMWPVAEVVPTGSGTYYLAVINTGQQPFTIRYIIYPGGAMQTVNQGPLYRNQYWLTTVSQVPAWVMVCSTVDPHVCRTVQVNNYTIAPPPGGSSTTALAVSPTPTCPSGGEVMLLSTSTEYWGVPHVYQGVVNGQPSTSVPALISVYGIPYLELTPATTSSSGAMYWCGTYTSGSSVTVTLYGTYISYYSLIGDGFYVYLFLQPSGWGISSQYNWSIPFTTKNNFQVVYTEGYLYGGVLIFPYSNTPYIVVQWDPYYTNRNNLPGDWNVFVVTSATPSGASGYWWAGEGVGGFTPREDDTIIVSVTYNPSTNTISGTAEDLSTGQVSSFSLSLNGFFTPPASGHYAFGIGAATGGWYAEWVATKVAFQG